MSKQSPDISSHQNLILASTSKYRASLLRRLHLTFDTIAPDVDEKPLINEAPDTLAIRLAKAKALAVAKHHKGLVIGSDQVAAVTTSTGQQVLLGKPGNRKAAIEQLSMCSGQTVHFYTAVALVDSESMTASYHLEPVTVQFRGLTAQQIARYVDIEQPYDCAGSFKSEGLGIRLFTAISTTDPNCIIGLPMIGLINLLLERGIDPLFAPH
ncbi:Maf family protein [Alteromonas facilis]|uniref:Maf family protein n=1 Tax=Alteromonas facilis TaxID=2048004 RepID=UPI000C28D43B|nr:Maf family nucleotide pyrophosphatase [Alteromonas facilis]